MGRNQPWYDDWEAQCELAEGFIARFRVIEITEARTKEILEHNTNSIYRLIYESNVLENAGLGEGETRKLGASYAPEESLKDAKNLIKEFNSQSKKGPRSQAIISFGKKSKTKREVLQHVLALRYVASKVTAFQNSHGKSLFSQKTIREIHFLMAKGLMPEDAGVEAGSYRIDSRIVNDRTYFVSHENLPKASIPTYDDIEAQLNMSRSTISKSLKELRNKNYLPE